MPTLICIVIFVLFVKSSALSEKKDEKTALKEEINEPSYSNSVSLCMYVT